jgi:hypothetical protein
VPRAITAFSTGEGFAEYKLGPREAFTPLAFSCGLLSNDLSPIYDVYLQWRDATNYPIHTQFVGEVQSRSVWLSVSADAEPFYHGGSGNPNFPQLENYYLHSFVVMRMPRLPLIKATSFGVYQVWSGLIPNNYPLTAFEPKAYIDSAHLWVEDNAPPRVLPPPPPPLLTHAA